MRLLLASNSPRRRELLRLIAPDFAIASMHDIDETYPPTLPTAEVPLFLSQLKAKAYSADLVPGEVIITADTVVINDGKILGKPHTDEEAVNMLMSLMGHTHTVVTGVTLTSTEKTDSFAESTEVTFDTISKNEIEWYVQNYRPLDKAGAYGIQEWIGCVAISSIKGCFYNVMGLPLHTLYEHLRRFGKFTEE
ncbi:MAG: Maf family nucleotide pyrophosphatase [Muribaculaceae bacterium]|nr:Maf family nucleotide pyrophosphatase [Muribaculaceae bacterium]